jgi:RimJ/RimL family protein N-acetyltransferase
VNLSVQALVKMRSGGTLKGVVARRVWSDSVSLGLRVDLDRLPPRRQAKRRVLMKPVRARDFDVFATCLPDASDGDEALQLLQRERMCSTDVKTLFVGAAEDGRPMYVQWLVQPDDQAGLHRWAGGLFPRLRPGDALVEGAYTFPDFRRLGLMVDGMWQLLEHARRDGATVVYTYVAPDNIASLRGCARVGFELDHVRVAHRRVGRTQVKTLPPDESARTAWLAANPSLPSVGARS